jgi:hypothetical protein
MPSLVCRIVRRLIPPKGLVNPLEGNVLEISDDHFEDIVP